LVLREDSEELVGCIYLDLFFRVGKFSGGAAFIVQSTREVNSLRQQPIITIVAGFPRPATGNVILLHHSQVVTLFHEIGHCTQHIFCSNRYQHLSGCRGELDFVELPSILFENFAWDHRVLRHFAHHVVDGSPIPFQMINNLQRSRKLFFAIETSNQAILALFDQQLFGTDYQQISRTTGEDKTITLAKAISHQHSLIPYVDSTYPHANNSHLCHYGASYYSYLCCSVFAAALWDQLFLKDPLSRSAGELYRSELLQFGSSRSPQHILQKLVGTSDLKQHIQPFIEQNIE